MKKVHCIILFVIELLFLINCIPVCFAIDELTAMSAINQAEIKLNTSFIAVMEAEDAGGDITHLLADLHLAGDYLTDAYLAFRNKDYDDSYLFALDCVDTSEEIDIDANQIKLIAENTEREFLLLTVAVSGIGVILLIIFSIFIWRFLKIRYYKKVLEMKPETE
jgi:hypothetical protein